MITPTKAIVTSVTSAGIRYPDLTNISRPVNHFGTLRCNRR